MKTRMLTSLTFLALLITSCSYDSESDLIDVPNDQGEGGPNTLVNYTNDIKPLMESSCVSCHGTPPTNGAPFSLETYDHVSGKADLIFSAMQRQNGAPGAMPPAGRLPQATIDLVQEWISNGVPE